MMTQTEALRHVAAQLGRLEFRDESKLVVEAAEEIERLRAALIDRIASSSWPVGAVVLVGKSQTPARVTELRRDAGGEIVDVKLRPLHGGPSLWFPPQNLSEESG